MERPTGTTLAGALATLREDLARASPPPAVHEAVMAALAQSPRRGPGAPLRWARLMAWSGAGTCAVVLAGSAWLMLRPPALPGSSGLPEAAGLAGAFVPLAPPERWPQGEAAPAWIVDAELPGERLAALGLPFDPSRAGEPVRAELLLHPSGEVLAVRFLR